MVKINWNIGGGCINNMADSKQKLEFRHELNYPLGSTATGQSLPSSNTHSLGKFSNTITAEFSFYF